MADWFDVWLGDCEVSGGGVWTTYTSRNEESKSD